MKKVARAEALDRLPCLLGLQINEAAAYVGIGVSNFQRMVKDRKMPPARLVGGVMTWDADELRAAYKAIPHVGGVWDLAAPVRDTSWDDA